MAFFNNFSLRWYDFNSYSNEKKYLITNFLHSVSINIEKDDLSSMTEDYYINDLDTIYSISTLKYQHPDFWWIIALINNLFISDNQWPRTQNQFETWVDYKYYNFQSRERIKFYEKEDETPTTIQSLRFFYRLDIDKWSDLAIIQKFNLKAISVYEFERRKNEKKKYIKIPKDEFIQQIERDFKDKMVQLSKNYK